MLLESCMKTHYFWLLKVKGDLKLKKMAAAQSNSLNSERAN